MRLCTRKVPIKFLYPYPWIGVYWFSESYVEDDNGGSFVRKSGIIFNLEQGSAKYNQWAIHICCMFKHKMSIMQIQIQVGILKFLYITDFHV